MARDRETTSVGGAKPVAADRLRDGETGPLTRDPDELDPAGDGPDVPAVSDETDVPARTAGDAGLAGTAGPGATAGPGSDDRVVPAEGEWVAGNRGPRSSAPAMDADPLGEPRTAPGPAPAQPDVVTGAGAVQPGAATDSGPGEPADVTAPAGDLPVGDAPVGDAPVGGTRAGEVPAEDTPAGEAPGQDVPAGTGAAGTSLISDEQALRESWLKIQSGFVDDPRGAVTEAAGFISDVTGTLVTALQDRERALRRSWEGGSADTEHLRNAIREYRTFFEALVKM